MLFHKTHVSTPLVFWVTLIRLFIDRSFTSLPAYLPAQSVSSGLELGKINAKLLGGSINVSVLVDGLDSLGGKAHPNLATQLLRVEPLPLEVDLLHLLDASVREGHHTSLSVGLLSEQITHTSPHLHVVATADCRSRRLQSVRWFIP